MRFCVVLFACFAFSAGPAYVQTIHGGMPPFIERLTADVVAGVFRSVNRVELLKDDGPTAVAAFIDENLVGYIFSTLDVLRAPGYSSTPFDIIAGVTLDGRITGATVLFHREPYLLNDARRTEKLVQFLENMGGMDAKMGASGGFHPKFVAGASISARAMRNAVLQGALLVLRYRTEVKVVTEPTINMLNFRPMSTFELVTDGALANVVVTNADLAVAMSRAGVMDLLPEVLPEGDAKAIYLDLHIGLATPPIIGRNIGGQAAYNRLLSSFPEGSQGLIFGSTGTYNYRTTKFNDVSHGFRDRISVTQKNQQFDFAMYDMIKANSSLGLDTSILVLPPNSGFDALQGWRANIFAYARRADGTLERFLLANVDYQLPSSYMLLPEPEPNPAWMEVWVEDKVKIVTLVMALGVLTLILARQSALCRSRRAHRWTRNFFLIFTLVWIGWIASAQLSIVHIINYLRAPFESFEYGFYLAEPLIVIISAYTAISLILLGRGVFCGWLCPFGALQELLAQAARALGLPQWNPPERLQKILWKGKYLSLIIVVTLAFFVPAAGEIAAEIEPFKTAITAMFLRGLPYVIYAAVLLMVGLFTERAFCRFLCPLGGALALLDRLHLIDMLKRRPECGNPCSLCERSCPVKAIESSGKIIMSECFQCLDCQIEYNDNTRCPPIAKIRKQSERSNLGVSDTPELPKVFNPNLVMMSTKVAT